jgi:hypothetical protein
MSIIYHFLRNERCFPPLGTKNTFNGDKDYQSLETTAPFVPTFLYTEHISIQEVYEGGSANVFFIHHSLL